MACKYGETGAGLVLNVDFLRLSHVSPDYRMADPVLKDDDHLSLWLLPWAKMGFLLLLDCLFLAVVVWAIKQLY